MNSWNLGCKQRTEPTDEADVFEQGDRLCSWRDSRTGKEMGVGSGTTDVRDFDFAKGCRNTARFVLKT